MTLPEQPSDTDSLEHLFETFVQATLDQMSIWMTTEGGILQSFQQWVDFTENGYTMRYEVKQEYWSWLQRYRDHPFWSQETEIFERFARKLQQTLLKGNVPNPISSEEVKDLLYQFLLFPVVDILERYDTFQLTQEQISECYSRYYTAWTATSVQWEVTIPLTDFRSEIQQPVHINSHFQLAPFTPEEKTSVWNERAKSNNLVQSRLMDLREFSRTRFKLMGSQVADRHKHGGGELHTEIKKAITTLRLVKTGDIGILACFGMSQMPRYFEDPFLAAESSFIMRASEQYVRPFGSVYSLQHADPYHFTEADIPAAQMIAKALEELDEQKSGLVVALRRFNQSYSRITLEDRIIDLTISLESCLLADVDETELTYRLALRGAAILAQTKIWPPENAQALLKAMYAIRSAIVHSGQQLSDLGSKQKKLLQRLDIPPSDFPRICEDIVRDILRTYVIWLAQGGRSVQKICGDLDRYILQSLAGLSSEDEGSSR